MHNARIRNLLATAVSTAGMLTTGWASAQPNLPCIPGTPVCLGKNGNVVVAPPPVVAPPVSAGGTVQGQGQGQGQAQGQGGGTVALPPVVVPLPRFDAQWQAHLRWRADIRLQAKLRIEAKLQAEIDAYVLVRALDPFIGVAPSVPYNQSTNISYGRMGFGFFMLGFGHWSGPGGPQFFSIGIPLISQRFRFNRNLSVNLDSQIYMISEVVEGSARGYGAFAIKPAVNYTVLGGTGSHRGSELYLRGGFDALFSFKPSVAPARYFGLAGGVGARTYGSNFFFGVEARLTTRSGFGGAEDSAHATMSKFRIGGDVGAAFGAEFP